MASNMKKLCSSEKQTLCYKKMFRYWKNLSVLKKISLSFKKLFAMEKHWVKNNLCYWENSSDESILYYKIKRNMASNMKKLCRIEKQTLCY